MPATKYYITSTTITTHKNTRHHVTPRHNTTPPPLHYTTATHNCNTLTLDPLHHTTRPRPQDRLNHNTPAKHNFTFLHNTTTHHTTLLQQTTPHYITFHSTLDPRYQATLTTQHYTQYRTISHTTRFHSSPLRTQYFLHATFFF